MKLDIHWQDEPELFEAVASALTEGYPDFHSSGRDEEGEYGERGYIEIEKDGKRYRLQLQRIK